MTREGDTNPGNNTSSATVTVRTKTADLGLSKSVSETSPLAGHEVFYTITVTNGGPDQADDIVIEELVPDGLSIAGGIDLNAVGSFDPQTRLWRIPTLAAGATSRLNVVATPGTASAGQVLTNTVRVTSVGATDPNASNDQASVSIHVEPAPILPPIGEPPLGPSYTTVGNTNLVAGSFSLPATPHVADPDNLLFGTTFTNVTTTGTIPTANGGNVTIEADGDFSFTPAPGDMGPDQFSFTVNTGQTVTTTITMQDMVWYVDNSAAFGGSGTSTLPFTVISDVAGASGLGDYIFLFEGNGFTTGMGNGITLKDGQKLVGEGQGLTVAPFPTLVPAGGYPQLSNISGPGVTLANNNVVRGLSVVGSQGPAILGSGISGGTFDNVTINSPGGSGILLSSTTGFFTISGVTTDDTSGAGLEIASGSPSATVFGLTVNNSLGDGMLLNSMTSTTTMFFSSVNITNAGGSGMVFDEVGGTVTINSSSVTGSFFDNFHQRTTATTPPVFLNIAGSSFTGSTTGNGLNLVNLGGDATLTFDGGSVSSNNAAAGIFIDVTGGTTNATVLNGTQFTGGFTGFRARHSSTTTSTVVLDIDGATFSVQNGSAMEFNGTSTSLDAQFFITVRNTTINGASDNGISMTHTEDQRITMLAANNAITGVGQVAIQLLCGTLLGHQPNCNTTLLNNTIIGSALPPGILLDNRFGSTACYDVRANVVTPTLGIVLNQSGTGLVRLERQDAVVGSASDPAVLESFIQGQNPSAATVTVNNTSFFLWGPPGACPEP